MQVKNIENADGQKQKMQVEKTVCGFRRFFVILRAVFLLRKQMSAIKKRETTNEYAEFSHHLLQKP